MLPAGPLWRLGYELVDCEDVLTLGCVTMYSTVAIYMGRFSRIEIEWTSQISAPSHASLLISR